LLTPATPLISEGDEVEYEQKIGDPADKGFSVGVWASMGGEISSIEDGMVAITGSAIDEEDAEVREEAKAQASAGGAPPQGEVEPFQEAEDETRR
jgi:Na+-translocating ferredoxin:NAD+ oxidoreductase RnfC subunit